MELKSIYELFTLSATCNTQYQWKILGWDREIKIQLCTTACICHKHEEIFANPKSKTGFKNNQNTNLSSVHQNLKAAVQHLLMPRTVRAALCVQQHYQGALWYSMSSLGRPFVTGVALNPSAGSRIECNKVNKHLGSVLRMGLQSNKE